MSLRAGVARWQRPARRSRWGRAGKIMLGLLAGLVLALTLAGYVFLWWVQADPREASPLTIPIEQARAVLLWGQAPQWDVLALFTLAALVIAWLGATWFRATRKGFADVL